MSSTNLRIVWVLLLLDLLLAGGALLFFDKEILYNTQVGFLSSSLVMFASMLSYRRMVKTRVAHNIITIDDSKDVIDTLEDPYDLYSEGEQEEPLDVVEAVKEEKARLKANRRSLYETLKDTKAALSLYRLGAYVALILGFLYLNRHGLLHIPSYLLALSLPMVVIVTLLVEDKANDRQDLIE